MVCQTALSKMKHSILKLGICFQKPGSGEPVKRVGAKKIETAIGAWNTVESAHLGEGNLSGIGIRDSGNIGVRVSYNATMKVVVRAVHGMLVDYNTIVLFNKLGTAL